jgi:hypothetical protein
MKKGLEFIILIVLATAAVFVDAWGFQVFWNNIVLNVWQMLSSDDVINTMNIKYGAFVAISVGLGMLDIKNIKDTEIKKNPEEAISMATTKIFTKLVMIGIALFVVSIVF